jgi:hypothetical protein
VLGLKQLSKSFKGKTKAIQSRKTIRGYSIRKYYPVLQIKR